MQQHNARHEPERLAQATSERGGSSRHLMSCPAQSGEAKVKNRSFTLGTALVLAGTVAYAAGPTDPQIAAIVVTANQVDIDAGNLAKSKAQSKEVKEFAERMV